MSGRERPELTSARAQEVASYYAQEAARLQQLLTAQLGDPALAEEALASAWEKLLRHPEVDLTRSSGWMYTVARNAAADARRRDAPASLNVPLSGETGAEFVDLLADPFDLAQQVEDREQLEQLTRLKSAEQRSLMLLATGHGYEEIAEETGFSMTKVSRSLREGRASLRSHQAGLELATEQRVAGARALPAERGSRPELDARLERIARQRERAGILHELGIDR